MTYNGHTIHVLVIDHCVGGVDMSREAMDDLTGGQAVALGRVEAEVHVVDAGMCLH